MPTLTFASDLAAPADEVWERVSTLAGINADLRPWLALRPPRAWRDPGVRLEELPLGEPLGRAWLLLGGLLPVEYDDLVLTEREPGRMFQERSSMLSLRAWGHRRTVEPAAGGCRVTDVLDLEPRWQLLTPVAVRVVTLLFRHRHRRLVARFGSAAR